MSEAAYDLIGRGYRHVRSPDPRIAARIEEALGNARSVLNIGAGTGSYEPADREVTAIEPSAEMIAQRPSGAAPVVQASAEALPFDDDSFDVAMAAERPSLVGSERRAQRDAAGRTAESRNGDLRPRCTGGSVVTADYFPEMMGLKRPSGASSSDLVTMLPSATSSPLPVPRDCTDHFFAALWARPEFLFDEKVVRPMWVWQSISEESRRAGRERLAADLESGAWEERYGHLRKMDKLDVGLRLVVAELDQQI